MRRASQLPDPSGLVSPAGASGSPPGGGVTSPPGKMGSGAGAVAGGCTWITEVGDCARDDMMESTNERTMKIVPEVQVARVSTVVA